MKISALITVTNPIERQDPWWECVRSVLPWADEIVIVNGGKPLEFNQPLPEKIRVYDLPWPEEWSWEELPIHLNYGLEKCTGHWVIRVDADYIFPADTNKKLREELATIGEKKAITMQKFSSVLVSRWYQKGPVIMGINKAFNVVFGKAKDKETDLCEPIIWDGEFLNESPAGNKIRPIPLGVSLKDDEVGRTHVEVFNYDYTFKTKEFTAKEFYRFSRAYAKFFGSSKWGQSPEDSLRVFVKMMKDRLPKCVYKKSLGDHPTFIVGKVSEIKPTEFGYNGWGLLK